MAPEFEIDPEMEAATRAEFQAGHFLTTEQYLAEIKARDANQSAD